MRVICGIMLSVRSSTVIYYDMIAITLSLTGDPAAITLFSVIMGTMIYTSGYNTVRYRNNSRSVGSV